MTFIIVSLFRYNFYLTKYIKNLVVKKKNKKTFLTLIVQKKNKQKNENKLIFTAIFLKF